MNKIDSKILIKILQNISSEINQKSLTYLLLVNESSVTRLIYGLKGESYWPNPTNWLKHAKEFLGFDTKIYRSVGINLLELCCKKNETEIISLEQQFIDLFEEVFSIYLNSDFKSIHSLVLRILEEEHVFTQEISRVKQFQDISSLINFLVGRAKNKGKFSEMSYTSSSISESKSMLSETTESLLAKKINSSTITEQLIYERNGIQSPTFKIDANLPYIKDYAGNRASEINEIDKHFENDSLLFLYGMGGIGKSVLSILYAKHKITSGYPVYFIRFKRSFVSTIASLAVSSYNPYDEYGKEKDLKTAFDEKIELMKQYCPPNSLFIIDNVYENEKTFEEIIYEEDSCYAFEKILCLPGKILLTTRYEIIDFPHKEVGPLPTDELLKIMNSFYKYNIEETRDLRIELINTVYGHTLTVELLARTLTALRGTKTPQEVLEILRENISAGDSLPKIHSENNNKKESIFRHLCKLFSISGLPELELILLSQASLIGSSGLMSSLFLECCYGQNTSIDDCNNLIEKGWINYDAQTETFSMHPLIRSVLNKEIQNADEHKKTFLDKLLNIKIESLNGSIQVAEIILEAFQKGIPFNMNAVIHLSETSNRLVKTYISTSSNNQSTLEEKEGYIQKCMQIDNVLLSILQQVANNNKLSVDWVEGRRQQLKEIYKDYLKECQEFYHSERQLEIALNDLNASKSQFEQIEKDISKIQTQNTSKEKAIIAIERDTANIEKELRKVDQDIIKKLSASFSLLNHPYFDECLKLLKENYKETGELDLAIIFEYANNGVKNDILQSYLLLSLCYRWGTGTEKNLQTADAYQHIYLEKRL